MHLSPARAAIALTATLIALVAPPRSFGQNLLSNGGFEAGLVAPAGWRLAEGAGDWIKFDAPPRDRMVQVRGNGDDQSSWRSDNLSFTPGGLYSLRFRGRRLPDASGGTAVAGTDRVNRDFPLDRDWREYAFSFRQPDGATNAFVRLGQWHVNGALEFDDVALVPVQASHVRFSSGGDLGEAEEIVGGTYRFHPELSWSAANFHRPLWRDSAHFNSDRWVFSPGSEVVYRFHLPRMEQSHGTVRVDVNHAAGGRLTLDASPDGTNWIKLATLDSGTRAVTANLPASMLPATNVFVRLAMPGSEGSLQVNRFSYEAALPDRPAGTVMNGGTSLLAVNGQASELSVADVALDTRRERGAIGARLSVSNRTDQSLTIRVSLTAAGVDRGIAHGRPLEEPRQFTLAARETRAIDLKACVERPGVHAVSLDIVDASGSGRTLFQGQTEARVSPLADPRPGYAVPGTAEPFVWWCESGWKVGRHATRAASDRLPTRALTVAAARGETEAAQVVISPHSAGQLLSARANPMTNATGQSSGITVRVEEIGFVRITTPTDATGEPDWYPDPLPALTTPRPLVGGENLGLWLTFRVPRETPSGDYLGPLRLQTDDGEIHVPLAVHVYDFEIPRATHLRSALGLGSGEINRYHRLTDRADQEAVFEKYLQNFAEHRISPYSFYEYAAMDVRFAGEGTNRQAQVDFKRFDAAAARWLGEGGFNTFQLPLRGMGGGTFHSRQPGELEGFQEGTPEHARLFGDYLSQVERHLQTKGWLGKAFTYWFDEPDPKDYAFVVAGQERIKAAAPGLKRLLTEQPEQELLGHVDIWCGLTPEWTPEKVRARRHAGEEVWWYICTGPKAPYVTEFIDHPGTELRLWPWQSWQYGVTGILVWATIYWTSPVAYPNSLQDPWEDPMSWVSGYGTPVGTRSPWGNGDGRFLYPPRRDPNNAAGPNFDGPINSIRWENLRDGMEDYEYLWLLDQEAKRVGTLKREPELVAEAKGLLIVPAGVSQDLTHFTTDPRPILDHRDKVAKMIERLKRIR